MNNHIEIRTITTTVITIKIKRMIIAIETKGSQPLLF